MGAAAGAEVVFVGSDSWPLRPITFSSCRAAVTVRRSIGFDTSSKLDALSLSEASFFSANLAAAAATAASESLLSFIDGGGPRDATGAGVGSGAGFGGSAFGAEAGGGADC